VTRGKPLRVSRFGSCLSGNRFPSVAKRRSSPTSPRLEDGPLFLGPSYRATAPKLFPRLDGRPTGKVTRMLADFKAHNLDLYRRVDANAAWGLWIIRRPAPPRPAPLMGQTPVWSTKATLNEGVDA
jgi:hypothetical protein